MNNNGWLSLPLIIDSHEMVLGLSLAKFQISIYMTYC
jgi:hypothetical protein